jgi:hypothetical protein
MKYINLKSNRGLVNKMADFILTKLTLDYDSVIEVTDCGKFFVINGMTNSKEVLEMSKIKEQFLEENKELLTEFGYENVNVIDLIMYDVELEQKTDYWFTYHKTHRPSFSKEQQELSEHTDLNIWSITQTDTLNIELDYSETETSNLTNFTYSPLTTTSEFPYGHSLNMGRLHYYYSEYISNHIFTIIDAKKIDFKISTKLNNDEDFDIELISDSKLYSKDVIKSLVLDVFDFNLDNFKYILSNYDIKEDLELPFGPKPWLVKDRIEDLIVF